MTEIALTNQTLTVSLTGWDRLWALRRRIAVPLTSVRGADVAEAEAARGPRGLRVGGTAIPHRLYAGRFWRPGERTFWNVHDPARAIAIELDGDPYARLVVEVADPAGTVAAIRRALAGEVRR